MAHGRFLEEKFGSGSTGGVLDVGAAPLPPLPDGPAGSGLRLQPPAGGDA